MSMNRVDSGRMTPEREAELKALKEDRRNRLRDDLDSHEIDWDIEKVTSKEEAIRDHLNFCDRDMALEDPFAEGGRRK